MTKPVRTDMLKSITKQIYNNIDNKIHKEIYIVHLKLNIVAF